eukprot:jgi/Mesvir1/16020/Mv08316-RA.1
MGKAAQSRKAYRAEKRALNEERRARRAEKEAQKRRAASTNPLRERNRGGRRGSHNPGSPCPSIAPPSREKNRGGRRSRSPDRSCRSRPVPRRESSTSPETGRGAPGPRAEIAPTRGRGKPDGRAAGHWSTSTTRGSPGGVSTPRGTDAGQGRPRAGQEGERKSIAALIKQGGRVCGKRELDNETFLAWRNIEHYLKGRAHSSMNAADYAHLRAEHKYGAELLDQFRKGNFWPGAEHLKQVCLLHRETPSSREYAKGKATAEERARKANERADERMTRIREAMAAAREAIEDARDPTEDPVTTSAASEGYDDPDDPDDPDEPYADERIEIANPAADPARHNADASYYRRASSRPTSKSRSTRDDAPGARRTGRRGPINPWSKTPTRRRATGTRTRHRRP